MPWAPNYSVTRSSKLSCPYDVCIFMLALHAAQPAANPYLKKNSFRSINRRLTRASVSFGSVPHPSIPPPPVDHMACAAKAEPQQLGGFRGPRVDGNPFVELSLLQSLQCGCMSSSHDCGHAQCPTVVPRVRTPFAFYDLPLPESTSFPVEELKKRDQTRSQKKMFPFTALPLNILHLASSLLSLS